MTGCIDNVRRPATPPRWAGTGSDQSRHTRQLAPSATVSQRPDRRIAAEQYAVGDGHVPSRPTPCAADAEMPAWRHDDQQKGSCRVNGQALSAPRSTPSATPSASGSVQAESRLTGSLPIRPRLSESPNTAVISVGIAVAQSATTLTRSMNTSDPGVLPPFFWNIESSYANPDSSFASKRRAAPRVLAVNMRT